MLWVLIRSALPRHFWWVPTTYVFFREMRKLFTSYPLLSRPMVLLTGPWDPRFESCWKWYSAHNCRMLHCSELYIIILLLSRYDLNNVERDIKHHIIIFIIIFIIIITSFYHLVWRYGYHKSVQGPNIWPSHHGALHVKRYNTSEQLETR